MVRGILLIVSITLLYGCAAAPMVLGVGAAAGGAMVAGDRRTAGMMMDDERIELKTMNIIAADTILRDSSHINATSYNGQLLLTGEIPDEISSKALVARVKKIERVTVVKNEMLVGPVSDSASRTQDSAITARIKSRLISQLESGLGQDIKVVTERRSVYLMGLLTKAEAEQAIAIARTVDGVQRIVKVFEYQE
ncbi:MAG: BON domain-containing protein [Chromatiales bacterium]|nr:BON domain-containing protein [Chromatiales bacterium]